jgi:hypothetical protein
MQTVLDFPVNKYCIGLYPMPLFFRLNLCFYMQIWRYEGSKTLSYYLKRRDCISAIAADMEIPEDAVVPTVMKQIFENLQVLDLLGRRS